MVVHFDFFLFKTNIAQIKLLHDKLNFIKQYYIVFIIYIIRITHFLNNKN